MDTDNSKNNDWQYADDAANETGKKEDTIQESAGGGMDPFLLSGTNLPAIDEDTENTGKSLNRTTLLLFGICIVAVVAIFIFSRGQKPQAPTEEEQAKTAALDMALAKLTSQSKNNPQDGKSINVVDVFHNYPTNTQVSADELQRNPFTRDENAPQENVVVAARNTGPNLDALQKKLGELKLQSLGGSVCLINNNVLTEGDIVNDFVIKKIENNQVILTAESHDFVLKL